MEPFDSVKKMLGHGAAAPPPACAPFEAAADLDVVRCFRCGTPREEDTLVTGEIPRCHYCGNLL